MQTATDPTALAPIAALDELVGAIPDGCLLALPPDYSGCAMSAVRALIGKGRRNLRIVSVPSGGLQVDWLIGAGAVTEIEAAAMTLGEFGVPPRFEAAYRDGTITLTDATCPAIHAGLQAAEKGIPFLPLRGILGSDLLKHRSDWQVIQNPTADAEDPIVIIPAITPDVALFHAAKCDRNGNVWIGVRRELMLMAHAARRTLVTVEQVVDADFLADAEVAAGTIPALYIDAIAVAPDGAWPVGLAGRYPPDHDAIRTYCSAAKSAGGFARWLEETRAASSRQSHTT
ncbi:MAG: CoA-transferase [Pseudomonadota bacterium]